jgi:hypothetical protein
MLLWFIYLLRVDSFLCCSLVEWLFLAFFFISFRLRAFVLFVFCAAFCFVLFLFLIFRFSRVSAIEEYNSSAIPRPRKQNHLIFELALEHKERGQYREAER